MIIGLICTAANGAIFVGILIVFGRLADVIIDGNLDL